MVGVTREASWDFLHVNCRQLSKFFLQCKMLKGVYLHTPIWQPHALIPHHVLKPHSHTVERDLVPLPIKSLFDFIWVLCSQIFIWVCIIRIEHERAGRRGLNDIVMANAVIANIYQSLTECSSMLRMGRHLHLKNCLASPMVVAFVPSTYYTTQLSVVLKEATLVTAAVMLNPETQIFSPVVSSSPRHIIPLKLKYPLEWILHNVGLDEDVADKFWKVWVYRTVYVNVLDCSVGRGSVFLLVLFFTMVKIKLFSMDHSALKQIGILQHGDRIQIRGCIPRGQGVEVAVILMREDSMPYALSDAPKKKFNLNTPQGKPQTRGKRGGGEKVSKIV
ncbi:hypothetical protein VP01_64g2 [Puccinia sorghi]|uniref:Uncharacterized protein n=1 Tax=Puccinia sorghi TaxID=27349 RepID=A0A0L6UFL4_9BASI|nr:hypothetical protein VP01_64g2 [Puccinia sorghi]